jgi:hypothetical protein
MSLVNEIEELSTGSTKTVTFNLKILKNFTPALADLYGKFRGTLLLRKEMVRK